MCSNSLDVDLQNYSVWYIFCDTVNGLNPGVMWDCRRKGVLPNITNFLAKVNIKLQTEKYISIKNNTLQEFYDKWN